MRARSDSETTAIAPVLVVRASCSRTAEAESDRGVGPDPGLDALGAHAIDSSARARTLAADALAYLGEVIAPPGCASIVTQGATSKPARARQGVSERFGTRSCRCRADV